jgi:hypothetical protein
MDRTNSGDQEGYPGYPQGIEYFQGQFINHPQPNDPGNEGYGSNCNFVFISETHHYHPHKKRMKNMIARAEISKGDFF